MAFNFREIAKESTSTCELTVNRTKLDTNEVLGKTLTVIAFDFANKYDKSGKIVVDPESGEVDTYGVLVLKEYPDKYYNVGVVFTKICKAWAGEFGGDVKKASEELEKSGGVQVMFTRGTTRSGNQLINVTIV